MGLTKQTYCHKNNLKSTINTDFLQYEKTTENAFAEILQRRSYYIDYDIQFRTLVQSRSA
jgi:hypothetical protein